MAKTKIDGPFSSLIADIISSTEIDERTKEGLRRQAKDAMEIYSRARAFAAVWALEGIIGGFLFILAVIMMVNGQVVTWIAPMVLVLTITLVFGILTGVWRSRYNARFTHLMEDFSYEVRQGRGNAYPIVPTLCVIGPFQSSYRGQFVTVRPNNGERPINYSNLALCFIENTKGGTYEVSLRNKAGKFVVGANESAIFVATIVGGQIQFHKTPIRLGESTPVSAPKPAPAKPAQAASAPKTVKCKHCGKDIPAGSAFCAYCGKDQTPNKCPNCGAELPDDVAFCHKCGTRLGGEPKPEPVAKPKPKTTTKKSGSAAQRKPRETKQ